MDEPVRIPLTQGKVAIVDADDAAELTAHKWGARGQYAGRYLKKGEPGYDPNRRVLVYMHQVVLHCDPGLLPDHVNQDKLDNRKSNLRCCTRSQNQVNSPLLSRANTSGFRGVFAQGNGWRACINYNKKQRYLGWFKQAPAAARAYDNAARELFGTFATLNFPEDQLLT